MAFQEFPKQAVEDTKIIFMMDRQELDSEDPDSIKNTPLQEGEEPLALPDPGNPSSSHPLRDWTDDAGDDDDDDCTVVEVFNPHLISFGFLPEYVVR